MARNSEIVNVLYVAKTGMTNSEIADRVVATTGKPVTPEQVNSAINYQWEKDNYSIYADWDCVHTQYVYNVDLDYYNNCVSDIYGV